MKQTFKVPSGTKEVTFEQIDNTIVATFVPDTLSVEFKNGDIVVIDENRRGILDKIQKVHHLDKTIDGAIFYCIYSKESGQLAILDNLAPIPFTTIRFANMEEARHLFMQIEKVGLKWNEETKALEELKWIPKVDEEVFTISAFRVLTYTWEGNEDDLMAFNNGFIFKTASEAQALFNKVKQIAKNK